MEYWNDSPKYWINSYRKRNYNIMNKNEKKINYAECPHCKENNKKSSDEVKDEKPCLCNHDKNEPVASSGCCLSDKVDKSLNTDSCCSTEPTKNNLNVGSCCSGESVKSNAKAPVGSCCSGNENKNSDEKKRIVNRIIILTISLASLILGFFNWHEIGFMLFYYVNPSWVAVILCGVPILKNAIKALSKKKITAAVLITTAIIASIALEIITLVTNTHSSHAHSYIFAAGEVAFLMKIGGLIEAATVRKTRSGIERLIALIPKDAFVKTESGLVKTALKDINIDDIVVAKAGEMIAVDGVIVNGASTIDQSSVTGEYLPVESKLGDNVYGGTFNQSGVIEIRVTKLLKDMTVAKMAELVEEAEGKAAPISRVADRWSSVIVPSAIFLAIAVGFIAYYAFSLAFNLALVRAVTVLVVFCPCALALATPTAIAAGIGNAARNGVLIKSGQSIEAMSRIDTLCFDKTGTLTTGEIALSDIALKEKVDKADFIRLLAGVESYSDHPIAKAVINYASEIELPVPSDVNTIHGVGIEANVEGKNVKIYNYGYADKQGYQNDMIKTFAEKEMGQGKTVITVIIDDILQGAVSFSDTIRYNAKENIAKITAKGYSVLMLTGDNEKSANYIAAETGIPEVKHSLLPADKQNLIAKYMGEGKKVCMLGDGINDAPSLKTADCGIAMGALGNDIALDTADMAILNSDIGKVYDTLVLSKRVLNTIRRNILIAMSINIIAVVLSAFGILTPVTGAIVHNFTSILVVLSSALLLRRTKNEAKK